MRTEALCIPILRSRASLSGPAPRKGTPVGANARLWGVTIAGKILIVLGAGLLLLAGIFLLDAVIPSGGWGLGGPRFGLIVAAFPGVPGAFALLAGIYLVRRNRITREFNEVMEWNKRPLRGIVCDETGAPIPKATVDVFIEGAPECPSVATMHTDGKGRFSADLPDGKYVLEVGVPEIGESSMPVTVSKSGDNPELQVKLAVASS